MHEINLLLLNVSEAELNNPTKIFNAIAKADQDGIGMSALGIWKCLYYD